METCYRKRVRLLTAIKIQTPVCIFLLPPEKDPKFPHKTLPALSRVLSLRRRLSGLRACNAKQFRVFLSLRSRLSGHRCVIQNSFEYFCPSGAAFRGFGHVMQVSFEYFCPSGAAFRDLRSMTASQFRVFLSLRSRLSGHRCVIQNSFGYFCPSGAAFRGTDVSYKTVSGIFVPPEPAVHILSPFKTNNKYIQEKSPEPPEPRNRLNKNRR